MTTLEIIAGAVIVVVVLGIFMVKALQRSARKRGEAEAHADQAGELVEAHQRRQESRSKRARDGDAVLRWLRSRTSRGGS